jgi:predicted enzyme related to lactoylglutathione lyase
MSENAATMEQTAMMLKHGQVCWTEIATRNLDACKTFYAELFGWNLKRSDAVGSEVEYIEFGTDGQCPAGGMYQMGEEYGDAPSHWMSYVAVDDVDESAKKVEELGGKVCVPPTDIPNVGRFSVITDPTGATFSMITMKPWNQA